LELCADREDTATILSLLHCAIDYYRRAGATSVETVASDPAFISALKRTLFMQRMKLPLFFANGQKYSNPEVLRRLEAWHHCSGDSEGPY
jgi:hypothetical protein